MKVANMNNQLSFKRIFYPDDKQFTSSQYIVRKNIKDSLEAHRERFKGLSAVEHYEKKGIDFMIIPADGKRVKIRGIVNAKPAWKGVPNNLIYEYNFDIGTYDKVHPFKINDIESPRKDAKIKNHGFLAVVFGAIALSIFSIVYKHKVPRQSMPKANLVEVIDSTLNKTNALKQDSLNILR